MRKAEKPTLMRAVEPGAQACPFCGKVYWRVEQNGELAWLECASCKATGPLAIGPLRDPPRIAAIKAWNRRLAGVCATGMAAEYQAWIDFFHAGGSYEDFLRKQLTADGADAKGAS